MKIYIFRHAQKAMDFSGDPDLTVEGHAQAQKVLEMIRQNQIPRPTELWVSPKKRTHSTFRPLSLEFQLPLKTCETLLEQHGNESIGEFRKRIEQVLEVAKIDHQSVIFICSHYDWVLEAMSVIPCDTDLTTPEYSHWSPCQYVGFNVSESGLFEFIELKRI